MRNHSHVLVKVNNEKELSKAMRWINQSYSNYYRNKYKYEGKVFKDRFKSVPVMNENQLYENIRYIHNNPLNAHICIDLEDYKFSSYNDYTSKENNMIDEEFKTYILESFKGIDGFKKFHKLMQEYKDSLE